MVKIELFVLGNPRWRGHEQAPHPPCWTGGSRKEREMMPLINTVNHAREVVYIRQRIRRSARSFQAVRRDWTGTRSLSRLGWIRGSNGGRTNATGSISRCVKSHSFCAVAEKWMCWCKWLWKSSRIWISYEWCRCRGRLAQDGSPFLSQFHDMRLREQKLRMIERQWHIAWRTRTLAQKGSTDAALWNSWHILSKSCNANVARGVVEAREINSDNMTYISVNLK